MLLEKRRRQPCWMQGSHRPSLGKNAASVEPRAINKATMFESMSEFFPEGAPVPQPVAYQTLGADAGGDWVPPFRRGAARL